MKRNLLLISNSTNRGEEYLGWCREMIKDFCQESGVKRVLFIPYAGVSMGYDNYEAKVKAAFATIGLDLYSIHKEADAKKSNNGTHFRESNERNSIYGLECRK